MEYQTIAFETSEHITQITLNRPDALNALSQDLLGEMIDALTAAEADDKVRAILITGSEKAFAAGADITDMATKSFVEVFSEDLFSPIAQRFASLRKPTIAAVSGYALGGGCELAMLCDIIIASETAKFGQPEINLGVMAGLGGTQRLTRAIGKAKSMDMHLTGRFMDAAEAERSGLVSRVVPQDKLLKEARGAAAKIAEKSRLTTLAIKEAVSQAEEMSLAEGLLFERRLFHALFASEDQSEGMAAFIEKREPQFRDK